MFFGNSRSGIGNRQQRIIANGQNLATHGAHIGFADRFGLDQQRTTIRHSIARIDAQIDNHLLQLPWVCTYNPDGATMLHIKLHRLAQQAFQQVRNLCHYIGQLQYLRPQCLLTRKCQQLPRQAGCTIAVLPDLLDIVIIAVTRGMAQQHQIAITDDGGQYIIKIMRNTARKLPYGLHLGCLRHLTF